MAKVYGIKCTLPPKDRARVKAVMDRIRQRRPEDFHEIKRLVLGIEPYDGDNERTLGEWIITDNWDEPRQSGKIKLRLPVAPATIAHELGHAMTTHEDMGRCNAPRDEWASELTANWYAYRWGFGREIGAIRKRLDWAHHCVGPGQWIEMDIDGKTYRGRVTRNFCMKKLEA